MWNPLLKLAAVVMLGIAAKSTLAQPQPLGPPAPRQQTAAPALATAQPTSRRTLTKDDVDAWLDGYMPYALAVGDVAGGVVVVVKDGQVLTQRGFGYADVAARKRVDPANTMFRPGSVSKLFVWTAVMQMVEAGKINLDADINQYLDFKIPPRDGKPITMRNIMTHTPGFEESNRGLIVPGGKIPVLDVVLKRWMPHRVYAPGSTPAYSNYATALAGYIVQRLSNMSFDDYMDRNIFGRLGMTHATFRQPLPSSLAPFMAKGYRLASAPAVPYEIVALAPAGSSAVSGADMAKFMLAHLNNGGSLMKPETARLMHAPSPGAVPDVNSMALGFYEQQINGQRTIGHGGDTGVFHSYLWLFPQENVGVFVSLNSAGKAGATGPIRSALFQQFADRYFPDPNDRPPVELPSAAEHARMLAGTWTGSRRSVDNYRAWTGLFGQTKIGLDAHGRPRIESVPALGGAARKWVEVAPFVWQDAYGHERLATKVQDGKIVRWSYGAVSPFMVWDRTPWYLDGAWLVPVFWASLLIIALCALAWPIGAIVRRKYGAQLVVAGRQLHAHRLLRGFCWLVLLVHAGWMLAFSLLSSPANAFSYGWFVWLLEIVGTIGFFGLFAVAVRNLILEWREGRGWFGKLWSVLLVLAALVLLWTALGFKLISFGTDY